MHEHVCVSPVEWMRKKKCFCHFCALEHNQTFFFSLYSFCHVWFVSALLCMQSWHATRGLTWLPTLTFYFRLDWILRPSRHSVCDVHSGNAQRVPLWSWLAVKTSSPFNCLLPRDITLHPLTLDITTPQQVFWNCNREKTRWWCMSLFAKFPRSSLLSSHMNA